MKSRLYLLLLVCFTQICAQDVQELTHADKISIAEAFKINEQFSDQLFEGMADASFAVLLVKEQTEFLINHPDPSADFKVMAEFDPIVNSPIYYRKRQFPMGMFATMPAVSGVFTVVASNAAYQGMDPGAWVITLLHEHFHQFQMSAPHYQEKVTELDLANGDQTGMWMLNYPFPYEDKKVQNSFAKLQKAIVAIVESKDEELAEKKLENYYNKRKAFKEGLSEKDYSYFSFQIWQEGLARYVEYCFLELLVDYQPTEAFQQLDNYQPFPDVKTALQEREVNLLKSLELGKGKRVCFYSLGFGEGLILDLLKSPWQENYLKQLFYIEDYWKLKT